MSNNRLLQLDELERRLNEIVQEARQIRGVLEGLRECFESGKLDLADLTLDELRDEAIRTALVLTKGNRKEAAKRLGVGERTIYRRLEAMVD